MDIVKINISPEQWIKEHAIDIEFMNQEDKLIFRSLLTTLLSDRKLGTSLSTNKENKNESSS